MFRYAVRSLLVRGRAASATLLAIAMTVGGVVVSLGILEGLFDAMLESGSPANALVLSQGAPTESSSSVSIEQLDRLKVIPGVTHLSPELITTIRFPLPGGGHDSLMVRGVDPEALKTHGATVSEGALPQRGASGVVLGAKQVGKFGGVGGTMRMNRFRWPIVGVLHSPGRFESEVWCDRTALMSLLRTSKLSSINVTLDNPDDLPRFANEVSKILPNPLEVVREQDYYRRSTEKLTIYLRAVLIVTLLLVLGAIFACSNLMYALFLDRIRELGTLLAIGYTWRSIAGMVLMEGILLSICGGAAGLLVGLVANGHPMTMGDEQLSYTIHVSMRVLAAGLAVSGAIGALGTLVAAMQALRLDPVRAIRE
jgi:ABC-type antimicrobial peptide transport system permease subunit